MTSSKASFYLSVLRDTGFVARHVPISQRNTPDSRRGQYAITDPYLRFFYRFMSAYQSRLALGQYEELLEQLQAELPAFVSANTWQELCREWVLRAGGRDKLPVAMEEVGSEWAKNYTMDVVGVNQAKRAVVVGDCFWGPQPAGVLEIEELAKKTPPLVQEGDWTVYYAIFAAAGWTDEARERAESIITGRGRRKWQPTGVRLLDLAEVDKDLALWSV
jgi:hypothetical protein